MISIANIQAQLNDLASNDIFIITSPTAPTNQTGKGLCGKGSLCIGTDGPYLFINEGTKEVPDWRWFTSSSDLGVWVTTAIPVIASQAGTVTANLSYANHTHYFNPIGQLVIFAFSYDLTMTVDTTYFTVNDANGEKFKSFVSAPVSEVSGTGGVVECPKDDAKFYFYRNAGHTGVWAAGNHKISGQIIYPWYN